MNECTNKQNKCKSINNRMNRWKKCRNLIQLIVVLCGRGNQPGGQAMLCLFTILCYQCDQIPDKQHQRNLGGSRQVDKQNSTSVIVTDHSVLENILKQSFVSLTEWLKEWMFYLMMHSTHFITVILVSNICKYLHIQWDRKLTDPTTWAILFDWQQVIFYRHYPTDRIIHTTVFCILVVRHWMEWKKPMIGLLRRFDPATQALQWSTLPTELKPALVSITCMLEQNVLLQLL